MPPPHDGNEFRPFVELMGLEKINEVTYRSTALPFSPNGTGRSYGGHVFAQAVWAAAHTVKDGFVVHVCMYNELLLDNTLTIAFQTLHRAMDWQANALGVNRMQRGFSSSRASVLFPSSTKCTRSATVVHTAHA